MRHAVGYVRKMLGLDDVTPAGEVKLRWRVRVGTGAVIIIGLVVLAVVVIVNMVANSLPTNRTTTLVAVYSTSTPATQGASAAKTNGAVRADVAGTNDAAETVDTENLIVHIVGAVTRPGIYWLKKNARVMDATSAAGGFTNDAQVCAVNLARLVSDGEQIVIPHQSEITCNATQAHTNITGGGVGSDVHALVNINSADRTQLDTLPGIGPALADRIIQWRTENGSFHDVQQLTNVPGIGDVLMSRLADLVTL